MCDIFLVVKYEVNRSVEYVLLVVVAVKLLGFLAEKVEVQFGSQGWLANEIKQYFIVPM